jgi:hypothetical protein
MLLHSAKDLEVYKKAYRVSTLTSDLSFLKEVKV